MRTYAPATTEAVLGRLLEEPSMANAVLHHAVLPARGAVTAPFPEWLDPRIVLGEGGRHRPQWYRTGGPIEPDDAGVIVPPLSAK